MDLRTKYMGMELKNPLVGSASPYWKDVDNVRLLEDSGAAAVVMHSLFEEQVHLSERELDSYIELGAEQFAESLTYLPEVGNYGFVPEEYLDLVRRVKEVVDFPVIASLSGTTPGSWLRYALELEKAGADGLELNVYSIPDDVSKTSVEVEQGYLELIKAVRSSIGIPVSVKLSTYLSSIPNMLSRIRELGVNAAVMFNRFYQPDIDLRTLEVTPNLRLSTSEELRERLRWISILYEKISLDLAVSGGVHSGEDVLKGLAAGARAVMMTSALLRHGIPHVTLVIRQMSEWLDHYGYDSVDSIQGIMSRLSVATPQSQERAHYMRVLGSYEFRKRSERKGKENGLHG
ncbi:MAG: dihydroorotate dehydrogenase-like protein [Chitinispirillaceae bacterium]